MSSIIKVNTVQDADGNNIINESGDVITVGASGDTVTVAGNVVKSNALQASDGGNVVSQSGTTITIGASGDTVALASGASQTGFGQAARPGANPIIINGDCVVAQRGTANADESTSGIYRVDRMNVGLSSIGEFRLSQESISSGDAYDDGFTKAFRIDCAVADASPASGDIANMTYKLEGNTVQAFKKGTSNAQKATLAFYVKCSKTGTAQVNLIAGSRMVSATYTVSSANTWEKKVVNFPADTSGAITNDSNKGMEIEWALDAGSDFTTGTVPSAWESAANVDRSVNDFALQDNTANDWAITGIQLEVGEFSATTIPPFQFESFGDNLSRCQRYCFSEPTGSGDAYHLICNGFYPNTSLFIGIINLPTTMRGEPSITTSGSFQTASISDKTASSFTSTDNAVGEINSVQIRASVSSVTAGDGANLRNANDANARFILTAEL